METLADEVIRLFDGLKQEQAGYEGLWDAARFYVVRNHGKKHVEPPMKGIDRLYDSTAIDANDKLASAQVSYICPATQFWFRWTPPIESKDVPGIKDFYDRCTEIAHDELTRSNFYAEIHEMFRARSGFGLANLSCDPATVQGEERLVFSRDAVGSFVCARGADKSIDLMMREVTYSARQMEAEWGREQLGPKAKEALNDVVEANKPRFQVLHLIRRRRSFDPSVIGPMGRPWEVVYVCREEKLVLEHGGASEQPFIVTRFMAGEGVFGYTPFEVCRAEVERLQTLTRHMDTLAELAVCPRIKERASQITDIDFRPRGRTVVESSADDFPKEWLQAGEYNVGVDRIERLQRFVERAFFVPVIETIGSVDREMSATEVVARENEKMFTFSPSLTLFINDFFPMHLRIFACLARMGKFGDPDEFPEGVLRFLNEGFYEVAAPQVQYTSKVALVLKRAQSEGAVQLCEFVMQLAQLEPGVVDLVDFDKVVESYARDRGVGEGVLRDDEELEKVRASRTAAMQEQAAAQEMAGLADAAGKVGVNLGDAL